MLKKPTLHSVAQHAGVSVATASQVLRNTGRISEKTRKAVLDAAEQLHYVRDSRAASMRSGENREIGLVIHEIDYTKNRWSLSKMRKNAVVGSLGFKDELGRFKISFVGIDSIQ